MRVCYLDAFSGISGDMTVGALLDAGAGAEDLISALRSLETGADYRVEYTQRGHLRATKFHVDLPEAHGHHHHHDHHHHLHLPQILDLISAADLPLKVKLMAGSVFRLLGEAESRAHEVPIEKVHFHEVGAADSIADIVGACMGLELLGVERVYCSPVNVGSGTVETAHGTLPVPAPATATLLQGKPIYSDGPRAELTTPTGAAIVAALAVEFGGPPPMRITTTGYGAGSKDFPKRANVLRALVGETVEVREATSVAVIEANIDDSSPELLGFAMERLLETGALDVTLSPLFMKKNRPGTLLRVIAYPEHREKLAQMVLAETSTFGVRIYAAERMVEQRRIIDVDTPHGKVRIKVSGSGHFAPEYEDCRRLAAETGVPLRKIMAEAGFAYMNRHGG